MVSRRDELDRLIERENKYIVDKDGNPIGTRDPSIPTPLDNQIFGEYITDKDGNPIGTRDPNITPQERKLRDRIVASSFSKASTEALQEDPKIRKEIQTEIVRQEIVQQQENDKKKKGFFDSITDAAKTVAVAGGVILLALFAVSRGI